MYTKETAILKNLFSVFNKELFQGKLNPIEIVVLSNIDMIFADPNPILYDMDGHYFGDLGIEEVDELLSDDEKLAQFVGDDVYYLGYFNGSEDPPKIYINIELFKEGLLTVAETLLHEMIHAFLNQTEHAADYGHGTLFIQAAKVRGLIDNRITEPAAGIFHKWISKGGEQE